MKNRQESIYYTCILKARYDIGSWQIYDIIFEFRNHICNLRFVLCVQEVVTHFI